MNKYKEIITILSENNLNKRLLERLFESKAELSAFIIIVLFSIAYIVALFLGEQFIALIFATIALLALVVGSTLSFIKELPFFSDPVKAYVSSLCVGLDKENKIYELLNNYSTKEIKDTKSILEFEKTRIANHSLFITGAIDKIGIFPTFLALFYAFHSYQNISEKDDISYIILGAIIGIYLATSILRKVTNWHTWSIYILTFALENHKES